VWSTIETVEELGNIRKKTMEQFIADFETGRIEGRYVTGELPQFNFRDNQFDLALCSHFLFLYSEQLSLKFHIDSIIELCRVAREVRIFPLLELGSKHSRHLDKTRITLEEKGYQTTIKTVDYEFQKGGNQLLKVTR